MTSTMNRAKYLLALVFAALLAVMLAGPATQAYAADPTGTITITLPTENQAPTTSTKYEIYKVFDATVDANDSTKVSYTLSGNDTLSGDMLKYFDVDSAGNVTVKDAAKDASGNLSSGAIAAIKAYVTNDDLVQTINSQVGDTTVTSEGLAYGYYFITTTTGTVVTIDSNNNSPTVKDKNTLSVVVKSAGTKYDEASMKAIAAVGTQQDFTAQITVGAGASKLTFADSMTNMTYVANSLSVTVKKGEAEAASISNYTLNVNEDNAGFTVDFTNVTTAFAEGDVITLTYKGLVTSDALSVNPATNTATLTTDNNNTSTSDTVGVYNAKYTITKQDSKGTALEGAGFKLYRLVGEGDTATKEYYQLSDSGITWVTDAAQATEIMADDTDSENVAVFTGLGDGTYYLSESTTPAGYNTIVDGAYSFTISGSDFTTGNLEKAAIVVNNSGTELPSTGGIGTTIFYVVGGILVAVAVVFLITRKRVANARKDEEI